SSPEIGFPQEQQASQSQTVNESREKEVVLGLANIEDIVVSDVIVDTSQARVTIQNLPDEPGFAATLFEAVAQGGIMVDMIVQNVSQQGVTNISFTIPKTDLEQSLLLIRSIVEPWSQVSISHDSNIAKISVAGIGLRSHTGVGERMFAALAGSQINIQMVGTSEMRMTAVIQESQAESAREVLSKTFL
ncbi:MAG: ACT domain-containing protein, partial [Planctomycetaceae bacterium]|nr:ACT domain-containing protein [Planctomycetaceae bacterium]